jgi:hypothetical protein
MCEPYMLPNFNTSSAKQHQAAHKKGLREQAVQWLHSHSMTVVHSLHVSKALQ